MELNNNLFLSYVSLLEEVYEIQRIIIMRECEQLPKHESEYLAENHHKLEHHIGRHGGVRQPGTRREQ